LRDLRAKISVEADIVLKARSRALGKDVSEVVRDVLHEWASRELEASRMLEGLARIEGIFGKGRE
jgi:hypothetical protein